MTEQKATKLYTIYGKYSNIVTYEYRGMKYDVEYATGMDFCCTPAKIQHKDAQQKIDETLNKPESEAKPITIDEIFEILNYD